MWYHCSRNVCETLRRYDATLYVQRTDVASYNGKESMVTLAIIKPDAVAAGNIGKIIAHLEKEGFKVREAQLLRLDQARAESFYEVHRERPFFKSLVAFM